jgi:hypothetical protein
MSENQQQADSHGLEKKMALVGIGFKKMFLARIEGGENGKSRNRRLWGLHG